MLFKRVTQSSEDSRRGPYYKTFCRQWMGALVELWGRAFPGTHKRGWDLLARFVWEATWKEIPNVPSLSVFPWEIRARNRISVHRSCSLLELSPNPASGQAIGHMTAKDTWLWSENKWWMGKCRTWRERKRDRERQKKSVCERESTSSGVMYSQSWVEPEAFSK